MLNKFLIVCRIIASPPCHSLAGISRHRVVLCMPLFGGAEGDGRPTLTEEGYLNMSARRKHRTRKCSFVKGS